MAYVVLNIEPIDHVAGDERFRIANPIFIYGIKSVGQAAAILNLAFPKKSMT